QHPASRASTPPSYAGLSSHDAPTSVMHPLSLLDALPIWPAGPLALADDRRTPFGGPAQPLLGAGEPLLGDLAGLPEPRHPGARLDRKSTRLNSSHVKISYAVFCLKKKMMARRGGRWTAAN